MHIIPYHKKKSIQRFLIGVCVGGLIAYCILIFMYGKMYEQLLEKNYDLQSQLSEIKTQNEALLQDNKSIDEERKERSTVDRIEITFVNADQLRFDRLIIRQLDIMVKEEINHIIGQDIKIVAESNQLLQSTIENKAFSVDDFTYFFEIKQLIMVSNTVKLSLIAKISY